MIEVYGRELEKRAGYAKSAPLVEVATLSRDEELVTWQARIATGACISTFPEQLMAVLPPLVVGPPIRIQGNDGVLRQRQWRLPMVISGDSGTWHECPRNPGYLADSRDVGMIGMDVLKDLTLILDGGRFWLLDPERFAVNIIRR